MRKTYLFTIYVEHGLHVTWTWCNNSYDAPEIILMKLGVFRRVSGETSTDEFGKIDGLVSIQRGWLTEEMVIQFKLRESGINIWKRK